MPTRNIEDLLREDNQRFSPLQRLLKTSANRAHWTAELRSMMAPDLAPHVAIIDIKGSVVHISCTSAAIATRFRFEWPGILPSLQNLSTFRPVRDCKLHVIQITGSTEVAD